MRSSFMVYVTLVAAMCINPGCSGGSANPASPSGGTTTSTTASCRNYASAANSVSSGPGYTFNASTTCAFSTATNQLNCTYRTSDSNGASSVSTGIVTFASVGDFVSEVQVVPPLRRAVR